MTQFLCRRCNYNTNRFIDIKRHIMKKKQCTKLLTSLVYTNDQLLIMTLIPYNESKEYINMDDIKNIDNVYDNRELLLSVLNNIEKDKSKLCLYCNQYFDKYQDLKNHIIIKCFSENLKNNNKNNIEDRQIIENKTIIIEGDTQNIINNFNNINITNNIMLNIIKPIPFNEDWNLSHINPEKKNLLLFSKIMYTKLLEEILKNEINLNVIIDNDGKTGIVYDNKNDEQKYINMDIQKIIEKSMEKLNKNLLDILKNSDDSLNYLDVCEKEINDKFQKFLENKETKTIVGKYLSNIYENKKEDAIKIMSDIKNNNIIGY
jgi:hypothetical protein